MLSASHAGIILFVGQGVDAIMTPTVGVLSDKFTDIPYGQRKSWHLFGSILVAVSFPFVFGSDFGFVNHFSTMAFLIWSCTFVATFQIGWASTQVAHLSLIPELTSNCHERDFLNSARYAFTIVASVTVFGLAFGLLQSSSGRELGPADLFHFALLSYILVGLGSVAALYFHSGVKEPSHADKQAACGKNPGVKHVVWSDWFGRSLFYQVGGVYMTSRLVVNVSQVYLPLYLLDTLDMNKTNIAIAPLTVFIAGLVATSLQKAVNKAIGRRMALLVGIIIILGSCAGAFFVDRASPYIVYAVVVGLGVGGTTMLVTALAMEADLIGDDVEGSAFVYGSLSFLDKLSNGIAVLVIQFQAQDRVQAGRAASGPDAGLSDFYRNVMVLVPGASAVACALFMLTTYFFGGYSEYSKRVKHPSGSGMPDPTRPLLVGNGSASLNSGYCDTPPADARPALLSPSEHYGDTSSPRGSYGSINPSHLDSMYDTGSINSGSPVIPASDYASAPVHYSRRAAPGIASGFEASPDPTRIFYTTDGGDLLKTWDDPAPALDPAAPDLSVDVGPADQAGSAS